MDSRSQYQPAGTAWTVRQVAAYLNVDEKTVYRLVQKGKFPGFKVGGSWRFLKVRVSLHRDQQDR